MVMVRVRVRVRVRVLQLVRNKVKEKVSISLLIDLCLLTDLSVICPSRNRFNHLQLSPCALLRYATGRGFVKG